MNRRIFISVATPPPKSATTSTPSVAVQLPRPSKETLEESNVDMLAGTEASRVPPVALVKVRLYCRTQIEAASVGVMAIENEDLFMP